MESSETEATQNAVPEVAEAAEPEPVALQEQAVEEQAEAPATDAATADETIDLTNDETPTVDALEAQLKNLQGAMDQLQSGDLDGAERTIEALEQSIGGTRN